LNQRRSLMVLRFGKKFELNLYAEVCLVAGSLSIASFLWETLHLVFLPRFLFVFAKFQICS
jgi:hypothetical protein